MIKETAETFVKFRLSFVSEGKLGKLGEDVENKRYYCFNGKIFSQFPLTKISLVFQGAETRIFSFARIILKR